VRLLPALIVTFLCSSAYAVDYDGTATTVDRDTFDLHMSDKTVRIVVVVTFDNLVGTAQK
jgi:hypothetical protein